MNEHARVSFHYNNLGLPVEECCDEHLIERSYDKHGLIVPLRSTLSSPIRWVICIMIPAGSYASTYVVVALDKMAEAMHEGIFYE